MTKYRRLLAIFLVFYCFNGFAVEPIANQLRIVTEDLPPYNYKTSDGKLKGIGVKIVSALLAELKSNATIEVIPWARAYKLALSEPNVLIFSIARTPSRESLFHWLSPIVTVDINLFAQPNSDKQLQSNLVQAEQQSIGVLRDSSYIDFIDTNAQFKQAKRIESVSYDKLYQMHQLKRIHFFMAPQMLVHYLNQKYQTKPENRPKSVYQLPAELQYKVYTALSKTTPPQTVQHIRQTLNEMYDSGKVAKIIKAFQMKLTHTIKTP